MIDVKTAIDRARDYVRPLFTDAAQQEFRLEEVVANDDDSWDVTLSSIDVNTGGTPSIYAEDGRLVIGIDLDRRYKRVHLNMDGEVRSARTRIFEVSGH